MFEKPEECMHEIANSKMNKPVALNDADIASVAGGMLNPRPPQFESLWPKGWDF